MTDIGDVGVATGAGVTIWMLVLIVKSYFPQGVRDYLHKSAPRTWGLVLVAALGVQALVQLSEGPSISDVPGYLLASLNTALVTIGVEKVREQSEK